MGLRPIRPWPRREPPRGARRAGPCRRGEGVGGEARASTEGKSPQGETHGESGIEGPTTGGSVGSDGQKGAPKGIISLWTREPKMRSLQL